MPKRQGRKSKAQTPAPPSERIYGSKKNPKGSAASEKSASKIKLDEKTITALKNKLKEFKEKHPNKKNITLNDLKAVYRRGAGAYSKSHRPTITGGVPNTRNAWSMARVNKFLKKAGGAKVKAAYVQDDDLMKMEDGGVAPIVNDIEPENFAPIFYEKDVVESPDMADLNLTLKKLKLPIKAKNKIGEGSHGDAYLTNRGTILKVTNSGTEAMNSFLVMKNYENLSAQVRVYNVFIITDGYSKIYLIEKDKVQVADEVLFNFPRDRFYELWNLGKDNTDKKEIKKEFDELLKDWEYENNQRATEKEIKYAKDIIDLADRAAWDESYYDIDISDVIPMNVGFINDDLYCFDCSDGDISFSNGGKVDEEITCKNCGWSWDESQTTPSEKYICHKCGFDNKPIYEFAKGGEVDDKVIKERWAKKKDSLMNMADNIRSLRTNLRKDLKSDDEKQKLTALAISLMDKTAERVGNDESEANGHLGITGLSKKNVSVNGSSVSLKYIGKSGVKHEKQFSDEGIANALKDAIANSSSKYVFETSDGFRIRNDKVNRYLNEYDISAKDLRGYSANQWIVSKLREVKDKEILGDQAKRKKKFNEIVKGVAEKVGHGAPTLKKHYMLPSLEREWVNHGKIVDLSNIKRAFEDGGEITYSKGGSPRVRGWEAKEIKQHIKEQNEKGKSASWSNNNFQYVARPDGRLLSYDSNNDKYKFYDDVDSFIRALYRFQNRGYKRGGDIGVGKINFGTGVVNNIDYDHLDESQDIPNDGEGVFKKGGELKRVSPGFYKGTYKGVDFTISRQGELPNGDKPMWYFQINNGAVHDLFYTLQQTLESVKYVIDNPSEFVDGGEMKKGGELKFNDVVLFHEDKGNWLVAKNTIYGWLYEDPNAAQKIESGEYDYILFPPGGGIGLYSQKGYVPPLLKVWTKKYQAQKKGANKLIGIVRGWYDEDNKKLYIDMMTTRKDMRRKGVNSYIIKEIREYFGLEKEQVEFVDTTKEGKMFAKSDKFSKGGAVDLFEHQDKLPQKVRAILEKYEGEEPEYSTLESLQGELEEEGYTFDYGLDYEPYGLRKMEKGGEISDEDKKETYKKWKSLVNMSKSELEKFYNSEEGKVAGLTASQAKSQGIDSGRESARWIMKMKDTPVKEWTPSMWKWAKKQISFVSRMSGNKGQLYDEKGNKTRKHTSLLIWGHNPKKKAGGGELDNTSNEFTMNEETYNQLPAISDLGVGKKFMLKEHTYRNHNGKPRHEGCRYMVVECLGDAKMMDCVNLKVHQSYGSGGMMPSSIITRPIKNLLNKGREIGGDLVQSVQNAYKKGGELDPDKKEVKEYFEHKSGAAGGLLVGKRHSEGGIQAINKSTNQPLEMEGGEVVITRDAVSDSTLHEFNGKKMTNREILSAINESGGGVKFADGGDVSCKCSGKTYSYGGKTYTDYDLLKKINNGYGSKKTIEKGMEVEDREHGETFKKLRNGEITYEQFLKMIVVDHLSENPNYYDK